MNGKINNKIEYNGRKVGSIVLVYRTIRDYYKHIYHATESIAIEVEILNRLRIMGVSSIQTDVFDYMKGEICQYLIPLEVFFDIGHKIEHKKKGFSLQLGLSTLADLKIFKSVYPIPIKVKPKGKISTEVLNDK